MGGQMRYFAALAVLASLLAVPAMLGAQEAELNAAAEREAEAAKADAKPDAVKPDAAKPDGKDSKQATKAKAAKKPVVVPAKLLFGAAKTPAPLAARSIGFYAKGCLAGAVALPIDGPAWQAMRLSRNRNWGHPDLIALVEKLAAEAKESDGWPGLLVGDISQPRGGPMLTGHASHQVGLDADIWFTPMPDRRLSEKEREDLSATSMLAQDSVSVNPQIWTEAHARLLKRAAGYKQVERILVHPAIKKAVCESAAAKEGDRAWLSKVRAYWGHYYHFHVRIACPKGSTNCEAQPSVGSDDGCGVELKRWLALIKTPPKPAPPGPPAPERAPITLAQLPVDCRGVLAGSGVTIPPIPVPAKQTKQAKPAVEKAPVAK
jgi:penicillin-insensitive murein DD-endopeptidase